MIAGFKDKATKELFETQKGRRFGSIARVAVRKLTQLDEAASLEDLSFPPGNRLEALKGDRAGQHSIQSTISFGSASA